MDHPVGINNNNNNNNNTINTNNNKYNKTLKYQCIHMYVLACGMEIKYSEGLYSNNYRTVKQEIHIMSSTEKSFPKKKS